MFQTTYSSEFATCSKKRNPQIEATRYLGRWLDGGPLVEAGGTDEEREVIKAMSGRTTTTENNAIFMRFVRAVRWHEFKAWFSDQAARQVREGDQPYIVVTPEIEADLMARFGAAEGPA